MIFGGCTKSNSRHENLPKNSHKEKLFPRLDFSTGMKSSDRSVFIS